MSAYNLFHRDGPGRFYRGNIHTHTNRSDGGMDPEAVCRAYRQQGYDFLAITDHFLERYDFPLTDTRPWRTEGFTTLLGAELHAPALGNGQLWHMLGLGLPLDFPRLLPGETGAELAQRAADAGAFVVLAHPEWYGATAADLQSIPAAHAVEGYNEVCGRLNDRASSWGVVDQLLSDGRRVLITGGDDAHFRSVLSDPDAVDPDPLASVPGEDSPAGFACWLQVRAESLDPDLLLAALHAGDYYTSQGPVIHDIRIGDDGGTIHVTNSPVVSAFATGRPDLTRVYGRHNRQITRWSAPIEQFRGSYVRVTVVDALGRRAWSNPIWLDR